MRIVTDEGLSGYGQAETWKRSLRPHILAFREALLGEDELWPNLGDAG